MWPLKCVKLPDGISTTQCAVGYSGYLDEILKDEPRLTEFRCGTGEFELTNAAFITL